MRRELVHASCVAVSPGVAWGSLAISDGPADGSHCRASARTLGRRQVGPGATADRPGRAPGRRRSDATYPGRWAAPGAGARDHRGQDGGARPRHRRARPPLRCSRRAGGGSGRRRLRRAPAGFGDLHHPRRAAAFSAARSIRGLGAGQAARGLGGVRYGAGRRSRRGRRDRCGRRAGAPGRVTRGGGRETAGAGSGHRNVRRRPFDRPLDPRGPGLRIHRQPAARAASAAHRGGQPLARPRHRYPHPRLRRRAAARAARP